VWDGGGTDTYDMSNYGGGTSIDLAPGGSSVTSLEQRALLNYADVVFNGAAPVYARGTVFNALQHNGDSRSLIENANGGSGNDAISGNEAANILSGGGGADTITGGRGYDQMTGGAGADVFAFSIGDGGSLPHDAITDFQVGTDKLLLPTGAALHTEDDAAGQWVHYGADLGNNDWVQLLGVHGATLAQLSGSGGSVIV
jgi:Ca2+-binding RTX toxin-like protein